MQAAGNQLFTGAAFADDEHRFIQWCEMRNLFQHFEKAIRPHQVNYLCILP